MLGFQQLFTFFKACSSIRYFQCVLIFGMNGTVNFSSHYSWKNYYCYIVCWSCLMLLCGKTERNNFLWFLSLTGLQLIMKLSMKRHDTQHNDTQHNCIEHNGIICGTEHNWHLAWMTFSIIRHNVMLRVVMLGVAIFKMLCWVLLCWMSLWWMSWRHTCSMSDRK